jgi:hypothetical protein
MFLAESADALLLSGKKSDIFERTCNLLFAMENRALHFEGILLILFGLIFVVAGLLDKRRAENAEQRLIEDPLHEGLYATRDRVYRGAVLALIVGVVFLLVGIVILLI